MYVGVIGSKTFTDKRKISDLLYKLKRRYGDELVIASGGTSEGAEYYVRKYCIEYNIKYREFNPAYTSYNSNSAMPPKYYGKQYHGSQVLHRYFTMVNSVNTVVVFVRNSKELVHPFDTVLKRVKRQKKESAVVV